MHRTYLLNASNRPTVSVKQAVVNSEGGAPGAPLSANPACVLFESAQSYYRIR